MKKSPVMFFAVMVLVVCSSVMPTLLQAQDSKETMMAESKEAKSAFIKTDESMNGLFKDAYGYVVFPNIGKGALVVGGAGERLDGGEAHGAVDVAGIGARDVKDRAGDDGVQPLPDDDRWPSFLGAGRTDHPRRRPRPSFPGAYRGG